MLEINNAIAEIKNVFNCFINRLNIAKKGISELGASKTEIQGEKEWKRVAYLRTMEQF